MNLGKRKDDYNVTYDSYIHHLGIEALNKIACQPSRSILSRNIRLLAIEHGLFTEVISLAQIVFQETPPFEISAEFCKLSNKLAKINIETQ